MDIIAAITMSIGIYSLAVTVFGTISNGFSIFICLKPKLRSIPTFVFYALLLVSDTLALYWWNIEHYLIAFELPLFEDYNIHLCRLVTLLQVFSFQWSAWLLICMTVERYLSTVIRKWRNSIFKPKTAAIVGISIAFGLLVLNTGMSLSINYPSEIENNTNQTNSYFCVSTDNYTPWMWVSFLFYCFIPTPAMGVTNILLLHQLRKSRSKANVSSKNKNSVLRTNITVLSVTTLFIVVTIPNSIISIFFLQTLFETPQGRLFMLFMDTATYTFHGSNFLTLYWSNKQFAREVKKIFCACSSTKTEAIVSKFKKTCEQTELKNIPVVSVK